MEEIIGIKKINKQTGGFVYLIKDNSSSMVKIGWSLDPRKRAKQIESGVPFYIDLIAKIPCSGPECEKEFHKLYKVYHRKGEWFEDVNGSIQRIFRQLVKFKVTLTRKFVIGMADLMFEKARNRK